MNRIVKTALAIAAAGSVVNAGSGDNEWSALDSEISGLASSIKPSQDGFFWAALLRAVYSHSSDDISTGGGTNPDTSGFTFNDVDLAFWGTQGPYTFRVSADIDSNEAGVVSSADLTLEDAWVRWTCGEYFDAQVGQMKPRVSRSNSTDPEKMLFIDRTALGSLFDFWDNGAAAMGNLEQIFWGAWILNGFNGDDSDHLAVVRGEFKLGTGAGDWEGAMGSSDTLNATIGATFLNDDSADAVGVSDSDSTIWLVDFHGSVSQFGFGGEVASIDDDIVGSTDEDFSNLATPLNFYGDTEPWNVYVSYMLNEEWEFGVRYEDLDNSEDASGADQEDNTLLSVVANYSRGQNTGKWQAQWTDVDADSAFPDGSIFELGFAIGTTR